MCALFLGITQNGEVCIVFSPAAVFASCCSCTECQTFPLRALPSLAESPAWCLGFAWGGPHENVSVSYSRRNYVRRKEKCAQYTLRVPRPRAFLTWNLDSTARSSYLHAARVRCLARRKTGSSGRCLQDYFCARRMEKCAQWMLQLHTLPLGVHAWKSGRLRAPRTWQSHVQCERTLVNARRRELCSLILRRMVEYAQLPLQSLNVPTSSPQRIVCASTWAA